MTATVRAITLLLLLGAVVGCGDAHQPGLTPTAPSFSATEEAVGDRIATMQTTVDDYHASGDIDNAGIATGLNKLLGNAEDAARRGELKSTENMMGAFRNRVRAQRGKHIREHAADRLDADAQEVIDLSTGEVVPTEADLSVALTAAPDPVTAGEDLVHAVVVANPGPASVTDLAVSILIVGDVESGSAPAECASAAVADGLSYDCAIASLDAGADATLTITVVAGSGGTEVSGQADLTNWSGADDPDLGNNIAVETTVVEAAPSLGGSLQWTRVLGPATDVGISLNDVWGTSAGDVWAVGSGSGSRTAILHYDGAAWTEQPTGTTAGFLGVWGSSGNDVFFVGVGGLIRHFDGTGWSFHDTPTTATLTDVWGSSGTDVWAVGAYTLLHHDGATWTEKLTDYRLFSIWGTSSTDVWAVGPGAVLRYDGTSWEPQSHTFPSGQTLTTGGAPMAVWGVGSDVFIVGQFGKLMHYDAATDTWTQHDKPAELNNEAFHAVWGTSATDVYAVGSFGTVLHYDGTGWSRTMAGGPTLRGIWGAAGERFAVGEAATILHSSGPGWNVHSTGVEIRSVWGASATEVFAVGRAGLILRYDGSGWSAQNTGLTSHALTSADFHGVSGISASEVYVVGAAGAVLRFDGTGWSEARPYGSGSNLHAVWANASDDVFAVGGANTLVHYDGTTWSDHASPVTSNFQDVFGASGEAVWAVGSSGAIVHYDGTSWSAQSSGTTAALFGVWAAASNRAFATGNITEVLGWDGTAWTPEPITGAYSGRGIWGASLNDIFSAPGGSGALGEILHYDGSTWTLQDTGVGKIMFHDLWGSSATDVYAVGGGGTIVRGRP